MGISAGETGYLRIPAQPILIVDDHELVAGTLALALRQQGMEAEVATAQTREALLEGARLMMPALVLLDLDLGPPLGSGLDLIGPLVAAGATVVMVTAVTDRARLGACIEAGAAGVVSKAVGLPELLAAVHRAAAGEPALEPAEREDLLAELRLRRIEERQRMARFWSLTGREQEVLARLVAGEQAEAIAAQSFVSVATVRSHIRAILLKLGVSSQLAAVALARQAGWPPNLP